MTRGRLEDGPVEVLRKSSPRRFLPQNFYSLPGPCVAPPFGSLKSEGALELPKRD